MDYKEYYDEDKLYCDSLLFLQDLKVVLGPDGVNATLARHKDFKKFLLDYQRRRLEYFESQVEVLHN